MPPRFIAYMAVDKEPAPVSNRVHIILTGTRDLSPCPNRKAIVFCLKVYYYNSKRWRSYYNTGRRRMIILNERQISILSKVIDKPKINVTQLAKEFGVSQVTIRQDLRALEEKGMLRRFHGGAMPVPDDDIMKRLTVKLDVKIRIAKTAASIVGNGETVLIESGSTNALLAHELATNKNVTIITNSTFICRYIRGINNVRVTLLGGDYQHESEALVGPLTKLCLEQFHVDKVFIGVDGFDPDVGFTCVNMMRAEIARAMAGQAKKTIIVTDSSKFEKIGVACSFKAEGVDMVITDTDLKEEHEEVLRSFGIEVIKA